MKLVERYELPARFVSSGAFGGKDLDLLYVISARIALDIFTGLPVDESISKDEGKLFVIKGLGVKGNCGRNADFLSP